MNLRTIRYFFFGQDFADGLRICVAIMLPTLVLASMGYFEAGISVSLGALCVSIPDIPGPVRHKRNAMLICILFLIIVTIITGLVRSNMYLLGIEVLIFSFFFSMFTVYGPRAASVGAAVLVILILNLDTVLSPRAVFEYAGFITIGGLWYLALSLIFRHLNIYRAAQRALGDCVHEMVRFMHIKADFYDINTDLDNNYVRLIAQQTLVNEKQESVREILFRTRIFIKESTAKSRELVFIFVNLVDMYEDMSAMYYDYKDIRQNFGLTGILDRISTLISELAGAMDEFGLHMTSNSNVPKTIDFRDEIKILSAEIDAIPTETGNKDILYKIRDHLINLAEGLNQIYKPESSKNQKSGQIRFSGFTNTQDYSLRLFLDNLNPGSSAFKHSIRFAFAMILGYTIAKIIGPDRHSYWILLTILVIMRPSYSLTQKRNANRLWGTLIGGVLGVLILIFINNTIILVSIIGLFMLTAFSFQRINYGIMVVFMTAYVLIFFHFLGIGQLMLLEERSLDTGIGCAIALLLSYTLFPEWEGRQIKTFIQKTRDSEIKYLKYLQFYLSGNALNINEYKLLRKNLYVSSANLSAAFQRMLSEPKLTQKNSSPIQQFIVINHILGSNISAVFSEQMHESQLGEKGFPKGTRIIDKALHNLDPDNYKISGNESNPKTQPEADYSILVHDSKAETALSEHLEFIEKLSEDAGKLLQSIDAA